MVTPTPNKTQFISNENGEFRMRLYSYEYVEKGGEIYRVSKSGYLYLIEETEHAQKPWIRDIFERERKFQRRKELAQILERTHIPSPERRAYKRAHGYVGAR